MAETPQSRVALNLFVKDMRATAAFYARIGVTVPVDQPYGEHHAQVIDGPEFGLAFDSIALTKGYETGWTGDDPRWGVLIFAAESRAAVDALYADLTAAGYTGRQPPIDAFWGARYAVVEDPDGNGVGLMSPSDPEKGGPPPAV